VVHLVPTGVAAFGTHSWTINFKGMIPVKKGKECNQLDQTALSQLYAGWKDAKILIIDEKSMMSGAQMG
jgi:hypothetical protein